MTGDMTISISLIIAICGCAIGIYGFFRNRKSDIKEEVKTDSDIHASLMKLELQTTQIANTTNETRTDIKAMQTKVNELDKEVGIVKRDLETAFIRIDELKGGLAK